MTEAIEYLKQCENATARTWSLLRRLHAPYRGPSRTGSARIPVSQLFLKPCRDDLSTHTVATLENQTVRRIYDTGPPTIAGVLADRGTTVPYGMFANSAKATLVH